jgi:hypothetical protein
MRGTFGSGEVELADSVSLFYQIASLIEAIAAMEKLRKDLARLHFATYLCQHT